MELWLKVVKTLQHELNMPVWSIWGASATGGAENVFQLYLFHTAHFTLPVQLTIISSYAQQIWSIQP